jgi:hypothetical protein
MARTSEKSPKVAKKGAATQGTAKPDLLSGGNPQDDRASLRNLDYPKSNLGGLSHAVILDDSYHLVTLDRQRQLVLDRTIEFAALTDQRTVLPTTNEDTLDLLRQSIA